MICKSGRTEASRGRRYMIINQFRAWAQTASPADRADGVSALARAFLYSDLDAVQRCEAVCVLTGFLDDPSAPVRRALAEAFACAAEAPHHIVLALADDQASIAAIVLAASPVLSDAELIDCAAMADGFAQCAIASRPNLSGPVAAALAEIAEPEALVELAANLAAPLPEFSIRRMIERHGDHAPMREALLGRPNLPPAARVDLVAATMRALGAFVTERNWMSEERVARVGREAKDKAAITIAESSRSWSNVLELAAHLRQAGELTVGFVFRAILSGKIELFKATLSELAGLPIARVDGLTDRFESAGFAALYRKASLPIALLPAFRVALHAAREADWSRARSASLSRLVIERVLTACDAINGGDLDKLLVLLRRFESEAAREEARALPPPPRSKPLSLRPARREATPLILTDLDAAEDRQDRVHDRATSRIEPVFYTIDLKAIEVELLAA